MLEFGDFSLNKICTAVIFALILQTQIGNETPKAEPESEVGKRIRKAREH